MRKTQWFYGYKTAAKAQIKIETQGFDGVLVVLCLEGGVVTQVEAEEMAAIVNDARRDAAKSQLKLRIQLVTMSYSDFVKEYENVPTSLGHARQTTAPVLQVCMALALGGATFKDDCIPGSEMKGRKPASVWAGPLSLMSQGRFPLSRAFSVAAVVGNTCLPRGMFGVMFRFFAGGQRGRNA